MPSKNSLFKLNYKKLVDIFIEKLPLLNERDFKIMEQTFNDMVYYKAFSKHGVKIENNGDKVAYFTQVATCLLDTNKFDLSFSISILLEMIAIERAVINARIEYTNKEE